MKEVELNVKYNRYAEVTDMTIETFLFLLLIFSTANSVIVEAIKRNFLNESFKAYNSLAVIVGMIIGLVGTPLYIHFQGTINSVDTALLGLLMGVATALCSMMGYDKVKEMILQLKG